MKRSLQFLAAILCGLSPTTAAEPSYSIAQIGQLTTGGPVTAIAPVAINNFGQVVGTASVFQMPEPFLFSGGALTVFDVPGTHDTGSEATGFNNPGQIIGIEVGPQPTAFGFVYFNGVLTALPSGFAPAGINDTGQVAGVAPVGGVARHAFLEAAGLLTDLGTLGGTNSAATAINNQGEITGSSDLTAAASHAFLYSGTTMADIGTLGGTNSSGAAINVAGDVAGSSDTTGNTASHAFIYSAGLMTDLGTLPGYSSSVANGINAGGQVVGAAQIVQGSTLVDSRAFVYRDGALVDLNNEIPAETGWVLSSATAINDSGQIVGTGILNGRYGEGFLLTPYRTPPSCLISGIVPGPPKQLDITVQAPGSGLESIQVTSESNVAVAVPNFPAATTGPVSVTATKLDQTQGSTVTLSVTDGAGNSISCDPVDFTLRLEGVTETHLFRSLKTSEHYVRIVNGTPGLKQMMFAVNGHPFEVSELADGETRVLDIAAAMLPASQGELRLRPTRGDYRNQVELFANGSPGVSAYILIGDRSIVGDVPVVMETLVTGEASYR